MENEIIVNEAHTLVEPTSVAPTMTQNAGKMTKFKSVGLKAIGALGTVCYWLGCIGILYATGEFIYEGVKAHRAKKKAKKEALNEELNKSSETQKTE